MGLPSDLFLFFRDYDPLAWQLELLHHTDAQDIDVRPLLRLVRDIIERDTAAVEGESVGTISKSLKEKYNLNNLQGAPKLPYILKQITCEMTCKVRSGANSHSTTLAVLGVLQDISWGAKVVLTLTAFTLEYKHLWILVQINKYSKNALGKAIVKRFPMAVEGVFNEINNLVKDMLETTQCIVELGELPTNYISTKDTEVKDVKKQVPSTVYWIIRNVVAAATYITTLSNTKYKSITSELELSSLDKARRPLAARRLNAAGQNLKQRLNKLYELIEERKDTHDINKIDKFLYHTKHTDNLEVLDAFISAKLEVPPLYDGRNKTRVHLDLLRNRNVLLLISCLDITFEEQCLLEQSYTKSREDSYDIVWLPVIDDFNDAESTWFQELKNSMPWYSVDHPSMIKNTAIKFIKKEWHFKGRPILVVLDPQGKVVSPNAIHMMWIWQSTAFPFTSAREEALWEQETWRLELLVNDIDQKILDWIREEKYIFVFGGDEMEWIRKFTEEAYAVARWLGVSVEMVYVGRSGNKELVRRVTQGILTEQLSHFLVDPTLVWYFWTRIKCMIYSKVQLERVHDTGDEILQEIQRLNSHDASDGGWAILAKGSKIIVNGHGKIALYTLEEFDQWKEIAQKQGLDVGFGLHYHELYRKSQPSLKIEFPSNVVVPKSMLCPDCRHDMNIFSYFICHHDFPRSCFSFRPPYQG